MAATADCLAWPDDIHSFDAKSQPVLELADVVPCFRYLLQKHSPQLISIQMNLRASWTLPLQLPKAQARPFLQCLHQRRSREGWNRHRNPSLRWAIKIVQCHRMRLSHTPNLQELAVTVLPMRLKDMHKQPHYTAGPSVGTGGPGSLDCWGFSSWWR